MILFWSGGTAQTPIKSLYDDSNFGSIEGAYYKDTHNDLDNYAGTWKYSNGTTSITITLQKKTMQLYVGDYISYYEDIIIGEYKYIENGIEKVNTLPQLSTILNSSYAHNIVGNAIIGPQSYYCLNCGPNDRKLATQFGDPNREIFGMEPEMIFQRADSGGVQKLKLRFRTISSYITDDGEPPLFTSYTIPFGEYLLVKQP